MTGRAPQYANKHEATESQDTKIQDARMFVQAAKSPRSETAAHAAVFRLLLRCFLGACVRAGPLYHVHQTTSPMAKWKFLEVFPIGHRSDHMYFFPLKMASKRKPLKSRAFFSDLDCIYVLCFFFAPSFRFVFAGSILYLLFNSPFADYGCYSFSLTSVFFFFFVSAAFVSLSFSLLRMLLQQ